MQTFSSNEVLRFLGGKTTATGAVHGHFAGEVLSDIRHRPEGIRIKHRLNRNSLKMYNKQGSVLRVETTITDTRDIKVDRRVEDDPESELAWRRLRKGVADLPRRAHGLIRRVPTTHRYVLTHHGQTTIIAFLAALKADTTTLNHLAA